MLIGIRQKDSLMTFSNMNLAQRHSAVWIWHSDSQQNDSSRTTVSR